MEFINLANIEIHYNYRTKNSEKKSKSILNDDIVNIKGWKSIGNRLDNKLRMSAFEFKIIEEELTDSKIKNDNKELPEKSNQNLTLF